MSSSERHKARELARKFAAKSAGGVFAHLKRSDIAAGLLKRLDDPGLIRQATSSLCGPAARLFNVASQRPVEYGRFVTLLIDITRSPRGTNCRSSSFSATSTETSTDSWRANSNRGVRDDRFGPD